MKIVADENMPLVEQAFARFGSIHLLEGRDIDRRSVADADVLLVRSVTRVDRELLEGSSVRFVGSATIGTDHVDTAYLRESGIFFAHAPGSNAGSVAEYLMATLTVIAVQDGASLEGKVLGVVGYGNIGRRVVKRALALGMRVLVNDPPLQEAGSSAGTEEGWIPLPKLLRQSDFVTLHVPLETGGRHPTKHLIDREMLKLMKPGAVLINSSRGAVVSGGDLLDALGSSLHLRAALDVWEGEPAPSPQLVQQCTIATPHIAGYSYDGKLNGTRMMYEGLVAFLGRDDVPRTAAFEEADQQFDLKPPPEREGRSSWLDALIRQMYDIRTDDAQMREILALPRAEQGTAFNGLRKQYPRRRSFDHFAISADKVPHHLRSVLSDALEVRLS